MEKRTLLLYFIVVFTSFSVSSTAQRKGQSYASIVNSYVIQKFDLESINSILFEFKGDGERFTGKYIDLATRLRKHWKRRKKEVGFQYKLKYANKAKAAELIIPEDKNSQIEADLLCKIDTYNFKRKKMYDGVYEYSFLMNIELIDAKTNAFLEFGQLKIVSNHDAIDNNKAITKLINQIIKE